jgi:deoxyribose-phosphate aldolase
MYTPEQIAQALDLAVLRPTASAEDILVACELVRKNNIRTICVAPIYARLAVEQEVPVCAVVGFPHGTSTPSQKRNEAVALLEDGVQELDVVINYGRLLDGDVDPVMQELTAIVDIAHSRHATVKAIMEACYYTMPQLEDAAHLCVDLGVDFVKTSSGYGLHGANPQNVKALLQAVEGSDAQVKASGGIKSYNDAAKFLDLGCTRLGASRYKELLP